MKKLGNKSGKAVLTLHFCSLALWLGGVLSCLPILFQSDINSYINVHTSYIHMREIAWNVIGWGGIGGFLTGLILAIFTNWGLFRHNWIKVKLFLTVALILFGMFFNEHRILNNIELLEKNGKEALVDQTFLSNHNTLKIGMVSASTGFVILILVAVYKPWMRNKNE